jgi:hypothetical protein
MSWSIIFFAINLKGQILLPVHMNISLNIMKTSKKQQKRFINYQTNLVLMAVNIISGRKRYELMLIGLPILILIMLIFLPGCSPKADITSFEECIQAGYPVMESYPRQCRAEGETFVEEIQKERINQEIHICIEDEQSAEACTLEYDPVCAFVDNGVRCITTPCPSNDAITYGNSCSACADNAFSYYQGRCEDHVFVVCLETVTGFDPEEYAIDSGGICVEICPGNYDPYVTQTGITLCIMHYGVEEIESWQTCERSSDDCECVKAYETTGEQQIEDAKYRCVPQMYAERLLFRSGIDRLDEEGEQSVVIA